jgi:ankyrin repeat protein
VDSLFAPPVKLHVAPTFTKDDRHARPFCSIAYSAVGLRIAVVASPGHRDVVRSLLDAKADVNAKDQDGSTALMMAASIGKRDIVQLLLDSNADVNATTVGGDTVVRIASYKGHREVVQMLKQAGAKE